MSIYFPDGKGGRKLVGTDSGGGGSYADATTTTSGLMSTSDKTKLDGIENNAQANVIESVKVNGNALAVSGKSVNIDLSGKVDKVSGKQLSTNDYTTAEKNKLASITVSGGNVVIDTSNLVLKESGKGLSTNDYTNADKSKLNNLASITTAGENITITNGTIKAAAGGTTYTAGENITINGGTISAANTTYSDATTAKSGLMSAADKVKLNGVDTSKYVTIVSGKGLSTNDYTTTDKNKLNNLVSITTAGENITINGGTIKAANTTYSDATTVKSGLMSATDKVKLNSIDTSNFVQKDGNKVLSDNNYTTAEKNKLASITVSGGNVVIDTSNLVLKESGKGLSTNDYTNADKSKLNNLASITTAGENITITNGTIKAAAGGTTYTAGENISITGGTISAANTTYSDATTVKSGLMSAADKVKLNGVDTLYATKSEVSSAVASVWKFKGTVDSFSSLPSNASVGDVYNIKTAGGTDVNGNSIKAGDNVAKVSNGWDVLAGTIDLSGYATTVLASTSQNGLLSSSDKTWLSTATSILDGHTVKLNGTRIMFGSESNASAGSIDMRGGTFFTGTSFPNGEVRAYPGGTISLNGGEFTMSGFNEHGDGGTISATGLHGGVIDLSGMDSGGTIDLSPNGTITGNVVFTGTPFFQGGASGINGGTTYTAGENITIDNGVISATDTKYTAGENITINNGVISATDTKYTAGENITISGGIIKAGADFVNKDVNAERARINANSSHISLNLANITIDGGAISFHGNTYTSFYDDSRIYGNPTFIENPVFKGTPVFQGGVSGIKDATTVKSGFMSASDKIKLNGLADTVSSGNVYIPTTAFDSIMANFES